MFHAAQSADELISQLWQALQQCLGQPQSPLRYPCLATSGAAGPEQRSLVLRACIPEQEQLIFFTDRRSAKVEQIAKNPLVSLHFYEAEARWQVRLSGRARLSEDESKRYQYWNQGQSAWKDYASVDPPGSIYKNAGYLSREEAFVNFALLQVQMEELEILQISRPEHLRVRLYRGEKGLQAERLQP